MWYILLLLTFFNPLFSHSHSDHTSHQHVHDQSLGRTFYIVPPCGYEYEKLFDPTNFRLNEDDRERPFIALRDAFRALGYELKTTTLSEKLHDFAGLMVCVPPDDLRKLERISHHHRERCVQLHFEPLSLVPNYYSPTLRHYFKNIYTLIDTFIDNKTYVKFFYPQVSLAMTDQVIPFNEKKLAVLIASNRSAVNHPAELYSKRKQTIRFFERHAPQDFDFYGHGWPAAQYPSYRGELRYTGGVPAKVLVLPHYKFCICYENSIWPGYVTEKIWDCFVSGCVPVYWGAPNVKQFIPENCFVDRTRFASDAEMYQFISQISEQEHAAYLEAIRNFLESPQAGFFSTEYFIHTMLAFFIPQYDMAKVFTPEQLDKLLRTLAL